MIAQLDPDLLKYASPRELQIIENALKIEIALDSPLKFAKYVSPKTEEFPHLVLLDRLVVALIEHRLYANGPGLPGIKDEEGVWRHPLTGEVVLLKLAISMPPRHGKSYLISEHTPSWFLARYPDKRVLLTSYEADFAASWGLKARRHIENHPEFGVILDASSRAGAKWDVEGERGGMATAGAGGSITGKGFDLGIIDDPIKNAEDAMSPVIREKHEDWWHSTFHNRREPDAVEILMYTRWHEDDLGGRLTGAENDWYVINLPALAFDDVDAEGYSIDVEMGDIRDPLCRRPGEPLCPARYDRPALLAVRDSPLEGGRIWFSAQYQGRPSLDDTGIFEKSHFRYYKRRGDVYELTTDTGIDYVPVKHAYRFVTVDLAASMKTSADWTVFSCWDALPGNRLLLVDRYRARMESSDHIDQLKAFIGRQDPQYKMRFIGVEKQTYGLTLIEQLTRTPGYITRPIDVDKDKVTRALPAGQMIINHQIFFPSEVAWLDEWTRELAKFPGSTHDDQVDTLSLAVEVWLMLPISVREPKFLPATLQERVNARMKTLDKPKKRHRIIAGLGRW